MLLRKGKQCKFYSKDKQQRIYIYWHRVFKSKRFGQLKRDYGNIMIIIAIPDKVKKIKKISGSNVKWCYIGKDVIRRGKIAKFLGEENRFYLKGRLLKISEELRQPFLDFVAELGRYQKNRLHWWASKFASKSPFQTDFFLLLCYARLIEQIAKENSSELLIILEDSWLFALLKDKYRSNSRFVFLGRPQIKIKILFALTKGITYRFALFLYFSAIKVFFVFAFVGRSYTSISGQKKVAILSYIDAHGFASSDKAYRNFYLGEDIAPFLKSKHIETFYLTYLKVPIGQLLNICRNKEGMLPLSRYLKVSDIMKSIVTAWKPISLNKPDIFIGDTIISTLIKRELWNEFQRAGFNMNLMWYYAMKNFFARRMCKTVIYNFENQPFEKMICIAGHQSSGIKLIGYRNSSTSRFYLNMFLGRGEKEIIPLPHRLFILGDYILNLFKDEGFYPAHLLANGGAWRYMYLYEKSPALKEGATQNEVLVVAPVDGFIARAMLLDISYTFRENHDIRFLVKCHPAHKFTLYEIGIDITERFTITNESIQNLLNRIDMVICSASTVGIEALLMGKKVVRYIPESLISTDPLDIIDQRFYFTCYEGNCKETILSAARYQISEDVYKKLEELKHAYFTPVDYNLWLKEV